MTDKLLRRDFLKLFGGAGVALKAGGLAALVSQAGCDGNDEENDAVRKQFSFKNKEGLDYDLTLDCYKDRVMVVDPATGDRGRLHFYEGVDDMPVKPVSLGEYLVLTSMPGIKSTHIMRYVEHDPANLALRFKDVRSPTPIIYEIAYSPILTPGEGHQGWLVVAGDDHMVYVDTTTGRISVDQTADGDHTGAQAPIIDINDVVTTEEDLTP